MSPSSAGAGRLHDDEVAVVDQRVDHRGALDAQGEDVLLAARHLVRHLDVFLEVLLAPGLGGRHRDRLAGGDLADDRHGAHARAADELDGARDLTVAADVAEALQRLEVVVDDGGGADAAAVLDVADAGRVVVSRMKSRMKRRIACCLAESDLRGMS